MEAGKGQRRDAPAPVFPPPSPAGVSHWLRSREQRSPDGVFKDQTPGAESQQPREEKEWEIGEGKGKWRLSSTQGSILDALNNVPSVIYPWNNLAGSVAIYK